MLARCTLARSLGGGLAALALTASVSGCQIHVGERTGETAGYGPRAPTDPAHTDWAKKQAAFDATFAEEIGAFHAMEADLKNAETADLTLADTADALRARFVRRCIAESGWSTDACWDATFVRDITEGLARLRLRQGAMLAAAEEAYALDSRPDLRPTDMKIWRAHGLTCGIDILANRPCQPPPRKDLPVDLYELTHSSPSHDGPVEWQSDITSMRKTAAGAVFTFRPFLASATEGRSCGDLEWQRDHAGNDRLVRPCKTEHYGAISEYYPPAVVPASELGDFTLTKTTSAMVVYVPRGAHGGHLFATWKDTGKVTDRGFKVMQPLTFRGTPEHDAKPGYP
jgi:hypothetical protein